MTNSRDLIQRLADNLEYGPRSMSSHFRILAEARAYLAAPDEPAVPDGREPTDEELFALCMETGGESRATDMTFPARFARAVLARYGNRTPAPIPLSERQPEPKGLTDEELDEFFRRWRDENTDAESWLTDEQERRLARAILFSFSDHLSISITTELSDLRGAFERILCVARSSGGRTVGNIQLVDRLINATSAHLSNLTSIKVIHKDQVLVLAGAMADYALALVGGQGLNGYISSARMDDFSEAAKKLRLAAEKYNEHIIMISRSEQEK